MQLAPWLALVAALAGCHAADPATEEPGPSDAGPPEAAPEASSPKAPDTSPPKAPDASPQKEQSRMGDVVAPPDFFFQATRPIKVIIEGTAAPQALELRLPAGGVVFRGTMSAGAAPVALPIPLGVTFLRVVRRQSGTQTVDLAPVDPGTGEVHLSLGGQ
jgi:hypothetical protein